MNATRRTVIFAVVAAATTSLAVMANHFTKPAKIDGYTGFGTEFFRDFTDASKAMSIRVVSFDDSTAAAKVFSVEYKDGWKIPSFHDYPADGKDQLAKAAASVIGLKRGALATRKKAEHERFGVIDPLDEENTSTKGRGSRITLFEKGETALADFIVGKKVEGSEEKRYIRRADETSVYMVSAKFDVSTKFADWAETDLLKLTGWDLVHLKASRPKFNEDSELEGVEVVELDREKSGDPWKLKGLDDAAEELKADDINAMVTTLDDLRLAGVRPKPVLEGRPILNSDLKIQVPKELMANPEARQQILTFLRSNLKEKGFVVVKDDAGESQIASREGELIAASKDGVVYRLTFGSVFSGTEEEIEIGNKETAKPGEKVAGKEAAPKGDDEKKDEDQNPLKDFKKDLKKSRYLFVRAEFDEKLLGERPVEPVKPEPPPGVEPPADLKSDNTEKKSDDDTKSDADKKPADDPKADDAASKKKADEPKGANGDDQVAASKDPKSEEEAKKGDAQPDADKKPDESKKETPADKPEEAKKDAAEPKAETDAPKKEEPKRDLKAEYQNALKRFDIDKGRYATELKGYEAKIESGKQKVQELNDRFADWYYVISNDSFDKLRLNRADLIKKKEPPAADVQKKEGDSESKSVEPKSDAAKPDGKKEDDADKPKEPEAKKEADPKPEEKKSDDKKPDEKKDSEAKSDTEKPTSEK